MNLNQYCTEITVQRVGWRNPVNLLGLVTLLVAIIVIELFSLAADQAYEGGVILDNYSLLSS